MLKIRETLEDLKIEAKFMITNKEKESDAYQREIGRMQVLDRVRQQVVSNTLQASISQLDQQSERKLSEPNHRRSAQNYQQIH